MKEQKILMIKTGYSETLDQRNDSRKCSLGDVLRATPLLHLYKGNKVTWLTDESAFPLLRENPLIQRILPYDLTSVLQLQSEEFDTVINLEKIPGICAFSDKVRARRSRYGFTFNSQEGTAEPYDKAHEVVTVSSNPQLKKENKRTVQDLMFEMVGQKWKGEEYILGYKPKTIGAWDVGLNTQVGQKWPTKTWPEKSWNQIETMLTDKGYEVTRQDKQGEKVLNNLNGYMDWINSCKLIISNDSLGLHLSIALKKQTLGLFGPTPYREVHYYGLGKAITPPEKDFACLPCFSPVCDNKDFCMDHISPKEVFDEVEKMRPILL